MPLRRDSREPSPEESLPLHGDLNEPQRSSILNFNYEAPPRRESREPSPEESLPLYGDLNGPQRSSNLNFKDEAQRGSESNIKGESQYGLGWDIKTEVQRGSTSKTENDDTQMDMGDDPSFEQEAEAPKALFPLGQVSQVSATQSFDPSLVVFVSHLPLSKTTEALIEHFENCPGFKYAQVHKRDDKKGYLTGHVQFENDFTRRAALRQFGDSSKNEDGFKVFPYRTNWHHSKQSKRQGRATKEEGHAAKEESEDENIPKQQIEKRLIRSIGAIAGEMVVALMHDIDERFPIESRDQRVVRFMQIQFQNLELHFADVQALRDDFATVEALAKTYVSDAATRWKQNNLFTALCRIWEVYHHFNEIHNRMPIYPGVPKELLHMKDRLRKMRHQLSHCVGTAGHAYVNFEDVHSLLHVDKEFDLLVSEFFKMKGAWSLEILGRIREDTLVLTDQMAHFLMVFGLALLGDDWSRWIQL